MRLNPAILLVLCALLSACGFGNNVTALPTLTPLPPDPTTGPSAAGTSVANPKQALVSARQALAGEDFVTAVGVLTPLATESTEVAEVLAETHLRWGQDIAFTANGNMDQLRAAFDQISVAAYIAPPQSPLRTQIDHSLEVISALFEVNNGLNELKSMIQGGAEFSTVREYAGRLLEIAAPLIDSGNIVANAKETYGSMLVTIAGIYEKQAELERGETRLQLQGEALTLCDKAASLWRMDNPAGEQARACVERLRVVPTPTQSPRPTPTSTRRPTQSPNVGRLAVRLLNYDDEPRCVSIRVRGVDSTGWTMSVDGLRISARFQGGDARTCDLNPDQVVTISILNAQGGVVPGGGGVPTKGRAIMEANWIR